MNETVLQINDATDVLAIIALIFGAFMIGMSVVILVFYLQRKHRYLTHIALMALSYLIMVLLVAGAMNFRVFYNGAARFYASIAAVIACIMGFVGLMLIFNRRNKTLVMHEVLDELKNKGHLTDDAKKEAEEEIEKE